METHFTWKTKIFSRKFDIFQYEKYVGELKKKSMSRKTTGEMNGREFIFETKGFFKHETRIINKADNSFAGTIGFSSWKSKAVITYMNKEYKWQFDNFFRTRWNLSDENGFLIKYQSHYFNGTIDSYTNDEALILTGFFIRNYLKQKSAEAAAASS